MRFIDQYLRGYLDKPLYAIQRRKIPSCPLPDSGT